MKKTDKRVERNTQSVFALRDFLHEVIRDPVNFNQNKTLLDALKSQGALSKYHDEVRGIYPSSINTLKRICKKSLEGGFDALDRLRVAAFQAIENESQKAQRSNKITRTGMRQRMSELEGHNQLLQQELLLLSFLLEKAMRQARQYAEHATHDHVRMICEKEQKEIRSFLSLSITPEILKNKVKVLSNA